MDPLESAVREHHHHKTAPGSAEKHGLGTPQHSSPRPEAALASSVTSPYPVSASRLWHEGPKSIHIAGGLLWKPSVSEAAWLFPKMCHERTQQVDWLLAENQYFLQSQRRIRRAWEMQRAEASSSLKLSMQQFMWQTYSQKGPLWALEKMLHT